MARRRGCKGGERRRWLPEERKPNLIPYWKIIG
jgi:hypothetical protein